MADCGRTIAVPHCAECPPLAEWPAMALIRGTCPRCGREDLKAWRMAAARRVIRNREPCRRDESPTPDTTP